MAKRLCVLGLDCVTPQLLFGPWFEKLPNVRRLLDGGTHGHLVSTIPPITVPAWMSMMTSQDPGQLGVYGFRNRASHAYDDLFIVNGSHVEAKPVWHYLSRRGLSSIVVGVPLTYPPRPLRGVLVSSFLAPSKDVRWTFPASLAARLDEWAGGEYIIDVRDFRHDRKQEIKDEIYRMTSGRFAAFRKLLAREPWDFAIMVEMGPDRMHHAFWRYGDPTHRLHEPGHAYEHAIRDYYVFLDGEIGRLLDALPDGTSVMLVSDHGAKAMRGAFCINQWLIEQGDLVLRSPPSAPTRLRPEMIDWERTRAWSDGGYYARVFLNVRGREPSGLIAPAELDRFKQDLRARLEGTADDEGNPIGTRVFFPEDVYRERKGTPPDLIVYLGDLDWRSASTVGGPVHLFENDTGPDDANHAQEGVFAWQRSGRGALGASGKVSIYDVAPSILDFFGVPVPETMIGKPLP